MFICIYYQFHGNEIYSIHHTIFTSTSLNSWMLWENMSSECFSFMSSGSRSDKNTNLTERSSSLISPSSLNASSLNELITLLRSPPTSRPDQISGCEHIIWSCCPHKYTYQINISACYIIHTTLCHTVLMYNKKVLSMNVSTKYIVLVY